MKRSACCLHVLSWCSALVLPACGFVDAATEIAVGAPHVPRITAEIDWPHVDDLVGDEIAKRTDGPLQPLPGLPTSLSAGTLAHLQGLMALDGACEQTLDMAEVEGLGGDLPGALRVTVTHCGDATLCQAQCQGFVGMKLQATLRTSLLAPDEVAQLKGLLADTSPDAIAQIRLQFFQLRFHQIEGGKPVDVGPRFADYELGMRLADQPDETVVVRREWLGAISPEHPQRFEVDPNASFTQAVKRAVLQGQPVEVEVFQRLSVAQPDLYSVRLDGAGAAIDFQPEFVIRALELAKGQL